MTTSTVTPELLIAEARHRQRRRRLAVAAVTVLAAAGALAAYLGTRGAPASGGTTLALELRGFGTPLPAQIDRGPCPQGRALIELRPAGSATACVLTIRKWGDVRRITQTVRETYRLAGGTIVTRETQTIRFARDQRRTTATFRGRVVGGSGRYAGATGTVVGGGTGVDGHADWRVSLRLAAR